MDVPFIYMAINVPMTCQKDLRFERSVPFNLFLKVVRSGIRHTGSRVPEVDDRSSNFEKSSPIPVKEDIFSSSFPEIPFDMLSNVHTDLFKKGEVVVASDAVVAQAGKGWEVFVKISNLIVQTCMRDLIHPMTVASVDNIPGVQDLPDALTVGVMHEILDLLSQTIFASVMGV
jgi:hypothetical protein